MDTDAFELDTLNEAHRFGPSVVEFGRALEAAGDRQPAETEDDYNRRVLAGLPQHYTMREILAALDDPDRIRYS